MPTQDYERWHEGYDDPGSGQSWRLELVRGYLHQALNEGRNPIRLVSACAGDGRDVIGTLARRRDAGRVVATLIEIHPGLAARARAAAAAAGLTGVSVVEADAGQTDTYLGLVPADVVLLVGIFGNITEADIERTVRTAPSFCRPGGTLLWSRGLRDGDINDRIRGWFAESGFTEIDYAVGPGERYAAGAMRYAGPALGLEPGLELFTFCR